MWDRMWDRLASRSPDAKRLLDETPPVGCLPEATNQPSLMNANAPTSSNSST